ncbi:MAG: TetR/AcrR family transcriptional regulator [Ilumatobacteraceae bacterium]|nr:TetR/AcrR family transcriptional regulator [Ilumatobacteraceae bacterium]
MSVRLNAAARRGQILEVALEVFARAGFNGTSMNEVADAVGVTKPVLYQHFDSKRDLYQALTDDVGERLLARISKAAAEADSGKNRTELAYQAYFRWVADNPDGFRLLFGSGSRRDDEFNNTVRRITEEAANAVAPMIDVDIDTKHRRTLAQALVGMAEGASRHLVEIGEEFDPDDVAREISVLAWAGLRAVQPHD